MKKYLAVAVIFLFIGLAVAPSINANVSKEGLIEFTTEVCGLHGGKQTVKLTQEESKEVELLFKSIRDRLNATESREEAEEIFKEAIVELDKYGLLGGLSVKQVQRLVTGEFQNPIAKEIVNRMYQRGILRLDDDENIFCLITGETSGTIFEGYLSRFYGYINPLRMSASIIGNWLDENIPIAIGHRIGLGVKQVLWNLSFDATGWVHTNCLYGVKYWNGSLRGNLSRSGRMILKRAKPGDSKSCSDFPSGIYEVYQGVRGFRGIKVNLDKSIYYMGFATRVKISPQPNDI